MGLKRYLAAAAIAVVAAGAFVVAPASAVEVGNTQGCTPGFWKNHTPWNPTYVQSNYTTSTTLSNLFAKRNPPQPYTFTPYTFPTELSSFNSMTMLQALQGGGGTDLAGATKILVRAATAAYLNADTEIAYPYRRWTTGYNGLAPLQQLVTDAINSKDRATILDLATTLDNANNLGCPLS
ncbi:MAG: hypothetical protein WAN48_09860 [Actinomycetes bacterium]